MFWSLTQPEFEALGLGSLRTATCYLVQQPDFDTHFSELYLVCGIKMPLRKTLRDFQTSYSGREAHPKPWSGASDLSARNDSQVSDCTPPSSSQNSSLPHRGREDNSISIAGRSSLTVGASPAFAQTSLTAQPQTNLQDSIPLAVPNDLWDRAYEQLKAQDHRLIRQFERSLAGTPQVSYTDPYIAVKIS